DCRSTTPFFPLSLLDALPISSIGHAFGAGAGIGVTGVGQQVTYLALHTLTGDQHRRRAEGVGSGDAGNTRAFGATHHHYILATGPLDASRGDTKFKAGHRMQDR